MRSHVAHSFALADSVIGALLRPEGPGLVVSIDIGGSLFDVLAANAADAAGCQLVCSPSLVRQRANEIGRGRHASVAGVVAEPVVFGKIDGSFVTFDRGDPFESYTFWRSSIAVRSMDTWILGRLPLRLVHFGDPHLLMDQLAGAAATIARDRPILTLYPAQGDREKLRLVLQTLRYICRDLSGQPGSTEEVRPFADFGWIGVPEEKQSTFDHAVERRLAEAEVLPGRQMGTNTDHVLVPRQRRSREVFNIPASALIEPGRSIVAVEILGLSDIYPPERDGGHSWRWLGPRPRSRIVIPCAFPGSYRIKLDILDSLLESGPEDLRIIVEGREVNAAATKSFPGSIAFPGRLEPRGYTGGMEIDIVSKGGVRRADGDPRKLRLSIESMSISECP